MKRLTVLGAALGAAMLCLAPVSLHRSPAGTVVISVDKADARVGRPLTPGSVAGVHRRVHRRAYYGAAVGAAAVGAAATGGTITAHTEVTIHIRPAIESETTRAASARPNTARAGRIPPCEATEK